MKITKEHFLNVEKQIFTHRETTLNYNTKIKYTAETTKWNANNCIV